MMLMGGPGTKFFIIIRHLCRHELFLLIIFPCLFRLRSISIVDATLLHEWKRSNCSGLLVWETVEGRGVRSAEGPDSESAKNLSGRKALLYRQLCGKQTRRTDSDEHGNDLRVDNVPFPVTFVTAFLNIARGTAASSGTSAQLLAEPVFQRDSWSNDVDFFDYFAHTQQWANSARNYPTREYVRWFGNLVDGLWRSTSSAENVGASTRLVAYVDLTIFYQCLRLVLAALHSGIGGNLVLVGIRPPASGARRASEEQHSVGSAMPPFDLTHLSRELRSLAARASSLMEQELHSDYFPLFSPTCLAIQHTILQDMNIHKAIPAFRKCGLYEASPPKMPEKVMLEGECSPETWSPEYNCLMLGKMAAIAATLRHDVVSGWSLEEDEILAWIDFGYARERNTTFHASLKAPWTLDVDKMKSLIAEQHILGPPSAAEQHILGPPSVGDQARVLVDSTDCE